MITEEDKAMEVALSHIKLNSGILDFDERQMFWLKEAIHEVSLIDFISDPKTIVDSYIFQLWIHDVSSGYTIKKMINDPLSRIGDVESYRNRAFHYRTYLLGRIGQAVNQSKPKDLILPLP